jgi:hypothetical protein
VPPERLASDQPPTTDLSWLHQVIQCFEDAWERGQRPVIDDFVPDDPARRSEALVRLVQIDLERRLKGGEHSWPVGGKKPNDLGLFDMHGNVYKLVPGQLQRGLHCLRTRRGY